MPYGTEVTDEALDLWFNGGAADRSPAVADGSKRGERKMGWWVGRIEDTLTEGCFAVGGKISLADVLIYNTFAEFLEDHEAKDGFPRDKREAFSSKARTDAALAAAPKLSAICAAVKAHPGVAKWLATRGVQGF